MAAWFVVRILLLTVLVAAIWAWVDPSRVLPAVLAVLVATCPCALSLATPAAIATATSRLARLGVLVTHADAVEGLAQVDTLVLDKTGTLTAGKARLLATRVRPGLEQSDALAIAATLEQDSNHPIADALREATDRRLECSDAEELAGQGVEGCVQGRFWRIGRPEFVANLRSNSGSPQQWNPGAADLVLGNSDGPQAAFTISDDLREESRGTIEQLRALGLSLQIASGDRESGGAPCRGRAADSGGRIPPPA
jgi:Cu2+-exporting ATPase